MKLDFEKLFAKALSETIDMNGGSLESALYDWGIDADSEEAKAIKEWFGWEDAPDDYDESCSKKKSTKKSIKETWDGENVIDFLVDRAKGYMDEGSDIDDAVMGAIDTGLIYTADIRNLAIHYDTMPEDSELIEGFIEDLMSDMYNELSDYEPEVENDEDEDDEEEE